MASILFTLESRIQRESVSGTVFFKKIKVVINMILETSHVLLLHYLPGEFVVSACKSYCSRHDIGILTYKGVGYEKLMELLYKKSFGLGIYVACSPVCGLF